MIYRKTDKYSKTLLHLKPLEGARFLWLLPDCDQKQRIANEENYSNIINLADIELTSAQKVILSKGMDFSLPPYLVEEHGFAEFERFNSRLVQANPMGILKRKENCCTTSTVKLF